MKTIYTINENKTYNSREITFEGKPKTYAEKSPRSDAPRTELRQRAERNC